MRFNTWHTNLDRLIADASAAKYAHAEPGHLAVCDQFACRRAGSDLGSLHSDGIAADIDRSVPRHTSIIDDVILFALKA